MKLVFSRAVLLLGMLVPVVNSCATTINESAPSSIAENGKADSSAKKTISTIDPLLGRDELLTEMLQSVNALSNAMQKSDR